jgi:hypothetical protein
VAFEPTKVFLFFLKGRELTMKALVLILGALTAQAASAVTTANCPGSVKIEFTQVSLNRSAEQVIQELEQTQYLDEDDKDNVRAAVENVRTLGDTVRLLALDSAKSGRCAYGHNRHNFDGAEIYTKKDANGVKTDRLLVEVPVGPKGAVLRLYGIVETFSKTEVKIKSGRASVALALPRTPYGHYSAGGPVIFVGNVNQIAVTAGR